ncbi:uncharacterized protein RHOBADRAFT_51442 [Rhodotorula graminis WP1]|uniref:Golgi apparatus membrane protein TVP38 n=1 Tax=Rhodotorula graminis (strain WP1) TaxID=578459 RepID=A0A194SAJ2_RHOGW|nr:uncharacterized protein RHOBADRAFT_51442 [Rhodotorula graminis WP1]KPV77609.1 hypothetical protein RHOBADRAFT_51442 [Rhodotorula graminis WP1]
MGLKFWARNEWTEAKEAGREIVTFLRDHNWKKSAREIVRRKYWVWWLVGAIVTAAVVLLSIYRDTIIEKFEPHKQDIRDLPASWVIPIAVLVILSVPPLAGHEAVIMVIGLIWGVWLGFAITCAGTYLGEALCFVGFKYFFQRKANEIETKSIWYACIARLMRHGGLGIIIIIRFSAVPGHVVTAIQSTVGMSFWVYSLAIIVTLPKQLAIVYLGYMFGVNHDTASPAKVREQKIISLSVLFATGIATVVSLYIVYMRARKLYPEVLRDMEEAQVAKSPLAAVAGGAGGGPRPGGAGARGAPLERRHSLVEAAFEGEPGVPERSHYRAHGHGLGHGHSAWDEHDGEGDDWDSKSPAMRGGGGGGTPRAPAAAWQDGRGGGERRDVPELGYAYAAPVDQREDLDLDPASSYAHLPLASESDVGAGGRGGGAYEDPFEGPDEGGFAGVGAGAGGAAQQGRGGQYGALGRSR